MPRCRAGSGPRGAPGRAAWGTAGGASVGTIPRQVPYLAAIPAHCRLLTLRCSVAGFATVKARVAGDVCRHMPEPIWARARAARARGGSLRLRALLSPMATLAAVVALPRAWSRRSSSAQGAHPTPLRGRAGNSQGALMRPELLGLAELLAYIVKCSLRGHGGAALGAGELRPVQTRNGVREQTGMSG